MNISCAAREFLAGTEWRGAVIEPVAGDASARRYWRLARGRHTAILMDASAVAACLPPYVQVAGHLRRLGFSAPEVLAVDYERGCAVVEDFGDMPFARWLEEGQEEERAYTLATEVLIALHQRADAILPGWRAYDPAQMLADIELYLDWVAPALPETVRVEFRQRWMRVLPLAHQVPASLLLRDYHVANLMWLPQRPGIQQAGLIDFQDAYQGPVTYDLVSLLEDARRDVPPGLREKMLARYLAAFRAPNQDNFRASLAILAAQRHTRVLAIFARLAAREGKPEYQRRHAPRVRRLLRQALAHPVLAPVAAWFEDYGKLD
ncbi:MAG: phosphotransferase [Verrucomicrobiae bacterium]|nr:phosphotransferase [Verrucomicrobiae bacterium]